jgi:FHA domain
MGGHTAGSGPIHAAGETPTTSQASLQARSAEEIASLLDAERAGLPFLVWRDAGGTQRIFTLGARRRLTIGRRSSNDVVLAGDTEVSRVHAELEPLAGDWAIADSGLSRNGTFVKEQRTAGQRLVDGDVLRFGRTHVEYRRPVGGGSVLTASASSPVDPGSLTPTQRAILAALARPCGSGVPFAAPASNGMIAKEVRLSLDAVKGHLEVLYGRFEIAHLAPHQKRARLVECAFQWKLVSEVDR